MTASDDLTTLAERLRLPRLAANRLPDAAEDEEREDGEYRAYALVRAARQQAPMLELRFKTGDSLALGYPWLSCVRFDRTAGLALEFGSRGVRIRGRHLESLYAAVLMHRARWVREADTPTADLVPEAEPLVEAILVEE